MKKIFLKQYNALFDYPIVHKPFLIRWQDEKVNKNYHQENEAYNKWLQSKIEIVGEHSFEDNQVVVEGVDYEKGVVQSRRI